MSLCISPILTSLSIDSACCSSLSKWVHREFCAFEPIPFDFSVKTIHLYYHHTFHCTLPLIACLVQHPPSHLTLLLGILLECLVHTHNMFLLSFACMVYSFFIYVSTVQNPVAWYKDVTVFHISAVFWSCCLMYCSWDLDMFCNTSTLVSLLLLRQFLALMGSIL